MAVSPDRKATADPGLLGSAALSYVARGWYVFPLHGKVPLTSNGLKDASTDESRVRDWWGHRPDANVGIRTGAESGVVVLDVDPDHGGDDALAELERKHDQLPETIEALTGGGGRHIYFEHPGRVIRNSAGKLADGLDIRGDGGYVVAPPSLHQSGRRYEWEVSSHPDELALAPLPEWLLEALTAESRRNGATQVSDAIPEGRRDATLASLAGTMRRRGMGEAEITAALKETNRLRCKPPLDEREVERVARSISRYEPERALPDVPTRTLEDVIEAFQRWLYLPDAGIVIVVLGAIAGNLLEGDPVWLVIIAPPGGGKSEVLQSTCGLLDVHPTGTLTEPSLLSGTSNRDRDKKSKGGLLREIGDFGIILCKDFGSVLSMHRDARTATLAALREVYDGSWTRHLGTDGGKTLSWAGKVGLIAGATQTIDRHHAVMGAMGERFVLYRLPRPNRREQARRALSHSGRETTFRSELSEAVAGLFKEGVPRQPRMRTPEESERLVSLASLVTSCRSAVERDGYNRDVELVPDAEAPTRLVKVLARLLDGIDAIGADRDTAWRLVVKAALDSVPALRRKVIDVLYDAAGPLTTPKVGELVRHPEQTTRRALEDLAAHDVIERSEYEKGKAYTWSLSDWTREQYGSAVSVPEMSGEDESDPSRNVGCPDPGSGPLKNLKPALHDISGKVPPEAGSEGSNG
jgi:bifunctional DNA primase/polymerase-like protein/primase-like protein